MISIHALREEGDNHFHSLSRCDKISIHALREEGDGYVHYKTRNITIFLSTPSARRATRMGLAKAQLFNISIHALREEGDKSIYGLM